MNYSNAPDYEPRSGDLVELEGGCRVIVAEVVSTPYKNGDAATFCYALAEIQDGWEHICNLTLVRTADGQWLPGLEPREWISVEDRLPDEGDTVLVFRPRYATNTRMSALVSQKWFDGDEVGEVTHWMPLPTPPQGGGE